MTKQKRRLLPYMKWFIIVVIMVAMFFCLAIVTANASSEEKEENEYAYLENTLNNDGNIKYTEFLKRYEKHIIANYMQTITYDEYYDAASTIIPEVDNQGYSGKAIYLATDDEYKFSVNVPTEGLYVIGFDYYLIGNSIIDIMTLKTMVLIS